jgi:hypothetical protein
MRAIRTGPCMSYVWNGAISERLPIERWKNRDSGFVRFLRKAARGISKSWGIESLFGTGIREAIFVYK